MAPMRRTTRALPATTTTTTPITNAHLKALINQGVADALAPRDADRSQNGKDSHNSGTGSRRTKRTTRECTYTDFLKCQPMNFKGTEGVVGLTQWFEKMDTVFNISKCAVENQSTLMKMMTAKYCPRNEIKNLEIEIWELKVKGTDVTSYTQRFQELALLCERMFLKESDNIKKYAITHVVLLIPTFIASEVSLIVSSSKTPTVMGQKTNSVALVAFGSTQTIMVGAIAYKPELPQELSRVHNTFHVSNLKKCYADEPLAVPLDGLHIDASFILSRNQ
uniref:Tf2-1-like SH3-like domain-containing protein n=1 Tax=Tanacetum cinerariifolium TaxID=118510 RepID=A0A6L2LRN7_TANCI|nr:hypothetical protein [Tanacetum cinerariifolium]